MRASSRGGRARAGARAGDREASRPRRHKRSEGRREAPVARDLQVGSNRLASRTGTASRRLAAGLRTASRRLAGGLAVASRRIAADLRPASRRLATDLRTGAWKLSERSGRVLTPLRVTVGVAACAAIALGVSQYLDYRGIAVATSDYAAYPDIGPVAPAPVIDHEATGEAHAYVLVPVALLALVALGFMLRGRWRLGRLVAGFGALGIAIALLVDRPAGLEEGTAVRDFEGAQASLEYGFYLELASASVLLLAGLIAAGHARGASAEQRARARRPGPQRPRVRRAAA